MASELCCIKETIKEIFKALCLTNRISVGLQYMQSEAACSVLPCFVSKQRLIGPILDFLSPIMLQYHKWPHSWPLRQDAKSGQENILESRELRLEWACW